jgi:hypothetical protein
MRRMAVGVELVLVNGECRTIELPGPTDSIANALDRMDSWIKTEEGGWVQKSFIVEVRLANPERGGAGGSSEEFSRLTDAAQTLADQARR